MFFSNLTWSGLSPLARGLPAAQLAGGGALGIIPARAGFTPGLRRCTRPRVGSSPLARGLHGRRGHRAARLRIIPARAGFTRQPWRVSESSPDHPRSRGVYHRCWRLVCGRGGSSPLARGLRREGQESHQPLRIIPARAGFTVGDQDRSEEGVDHPRSRGVYPPSSSRSSPRGGSSPLARGLPGDSRYIQKFVGIIPARAGFTQDLGPGVLPAGDHPRSRGVYTAAEDGVRRELGSSPLARGLRARRIETRAGRGIIPARAGFTCLTRT